MGVNGLWTVVQPCARPTNLATLNRKRLAVDASIWIYQFLKAVRDKEGNALRNSHVVGFFRRICKLLWYGIQPVFVFDGGAPALKRATLQGRRRRREGRREDAVRTAGKLLAVQMHRMAEEEDDRRKQRAARAGGEGEQEQGTRPGGGDDAEQEHLPSLDQIVYADELGMSAQERQKNRRFHKQDAYHLPELPTSIEGMGKPDDPRVMSVEELEEYARQFHDGEDINLYDFSKIDFDGEFFKSLPPADRYNILNAARLRSRLRMGLSKDQLDEMFHDRMAFSRFQIERVTERNNLTQRLMHEMGMTSDLTLAVNSRVAGEKNREYILVKNEGAEGGWALGVVSREKDIGKINKPIDVDALEFQYQNEGGKDEDEWEDEEFEDVPIEGLNRLPRINPTKQATHQRELVEEEESLFVNDENALDLFGDDDDDDVIQDEEEDLRRAIEMSLKTQHGVVATETENMSDVELQDVPAPEWTQKAVEAPKPIVSTSGRMIAHIVNNRANAAVPQRRDSDASSDSDMDLQTALAAARQKRPHAPKPVEKVSVKLDVRDRSDGPLPFEKLNWRSMFSSSTKLAAAEMTQKPTESAAVDLEVEFEDDAGGFVREPNKEAELEQSEQQNNAPRPLPPWLQDTTDIRDSVRIQQQLDREMNAEDEEFAREEQELARRRRQDEIVEIESSSDDGSDIEILDAPPVPKRVPNPTVIDEPGAALPSLDDHLMSQAVTRTVEETAVSHTASAFSRAPAVRSPSLDEEMEELDVTLPSQTQPATKQPTLTQEAEAARIEAELYREPASPQAQKSGTEDFVEDDGILDPNAPAAEEFDDFSDPEDESLLVQMAEEVEEHARFASQLNNRTQRENQEAYEQELRALRTQQKKDRRDADEVTQVMVTECQALLRLFGIPYITAPMEAEAQCAELVRLNLVDGIVTDDSDIFLFGGTRVYKNMFNSNKFVECYLAGDLESELSLSRDQLISLAQLLGSDYTEGIPGVGPVTAIEILSEFPGRDGLAAFKEWWQDVQHHGRLKEADAANPFRRKFRKSHGTKLFLPLGFPSPAVFEAYLKPEVDDSPEKFQWGIPDLEGLRQFLMSTIGWGPERTDEVLVPVIRDMNKRAVEGTQTNITRYFEGSVGVGAAPKEAFAPRQRVQGSKRMADAVNKLRARSGAGGGSGGGLSTELPVMVYSSGTKAKRKRQSKAVVTVNNDNEGEDEDGDAEDADRRATEDQRGKGRKGRGKKSKASA